jgi:hypothetical protein
VNHAFLQKRYREDDPAGLDNPNGKESAMPIATTEGSVCTIDRNGNKRRIVDSSKQYPHGHIPPY